MKRAFTLIELLIVMGIIAILAGVLMGNYSGILERVKSAKCQSNLKNLANAVGVYSMNGHYPYAESAQYVRTSGGLDNEGVEICEFKGWVSWDSRGRRFPIEGNSPASLTHISYANSDREAVTYDKDLFAATVSPARSGGFGIIGKVLGKRHSIHFSNNSRCDGFRTKYSSRHTHVFSLCQLLDI